MSDDIRLYRFFSRLLELIESTPPLGDLHAAIHELLSRALPPCSVDAFVIVLHDPVVNTVNFVYFKAQKDLLVPPNRPLRLNGGGIYDWVIVNRRSRLWSADDPADDLGPPCNPVFADECDSRALESDAARWRQ